MMTQTKSQNRENLFIERAAQILQCSPAQITSIFRNRPFKAARLHKIGSGVSRDTLASQFTEHDIKATPLSWYPDAFVFSADQTARVASLHAVRTGAAFIQNASSYLPIIALEPKASDRYLDICAAPGGKAAFFASQAGSTEGLQLNDKSQPRVAKMKQLLRDLNIELDPKQITTHDARHLIAELDGAKQGFDKVLVDAECSTEGGVNFASRNPLAGWSLERIEELHHLQVKLASHAYDLLKPGGIMIYATCTLAPEENEGVVTKLLQKRPNAIVQQLKFDAEPRIPAVLDWHGETYNPEVAKAIRVRPSDHMEGFFLCRVIKPTGDDEVDVKLRDQVVDLEALSLSSAS